MEQAQNQSPVQQETKPKAPGIVIAVSWLMFLSGISSLLFTLPALLIGGIAKNGVIFGLGGISLIVGVGFIVSSFGLRQMRKRALYTLTGLTIVGVLSALYSFMTSPTQDFTNLVTYAVQIIIVVYFWAISKQFS